MMCLLLSGACAPAPVIQIGPDRAGCDGTRAARVAHAAALVAIADLGHLAEAAIVTGDDLIARIDAWCAQP
jgi:hypothetical protein